MTDITPSRYTSLTSIDVTMPVLTDNTLYSVDVTNSSGVGSGSFEVGLVIPPDTSSTQKYTLTSPSGTIELRTLEEGWTSTIDLPFTKNNKEDGQVAIFDDGAGYDRYTCTFSMVLDATNMALLLQWYEADKTSNFSITNSSVSPATSVGFSPFTPAYGDTGTFYFNILKLSQSGTLDGEKYQWFRVTLDIASYIPFPTYSPSIGNNEGNLQIGTIGGLRYPIGGYKPSVTYDVGGVVTATHFNYLNNSGWKSEKCKMTLELLHDKMSFLVKHLLSERASPIAILVPSGHFPYGAEAGDNQSFNSRLITDKLVVKHKVALRYTIELEFQRID